METPTQQQTVRDSRHTLRVPYAELSAPGSYVCNETGTLFRIPEDALINGRSPLVEIVAKEPTMMTKLSDNPWVPISKARELAADCDLAINF